ncbi:8073_t:CDS:1 [Cetraspora pellucida]|uniref:8073_t:CDS:1 n=1 Tax=Cetraspora pellucida TaxID=1433469 RepID=A0ACA9KY84_9GLOM|nr:8073_t:CDS:1 [Cetraspora pellucida]
MTASEQIHISAFVHNNALYANLWGKVSSFALNKINKQYQKANYVTAQELLPPCTRFFTRTIGLSCVYDIQNLRNHQSLLLKVIHRHWWIQEHPPTSQIDDNNFHYKDSLQSLLQILK